jgi:O-antigen ligase
MDWARDIAPLLNLLLIPVFADNFKARENRWLLYLVFIPVGLGLFRDILYMAAHYGMVNIIWLLYYPIRLSTFHPAVFFSLGLVMYLQKAAHRNLWFMVSLLGVGVTMLTPTRTVWLSLGFMAGLLLIFYSQHRKKAIAIMILTMVLLGLAIFRGGQVSETQAGRWDQMLGYRSDLSVKSRFDELYQAIDLFKTSPIYGVGFGYQYHFWRNWVNALKGSGYMDTNFTHNDIINVIAKGGLAGLAIFGLMIYGLMRKLVERRRSISEQVAKAWATLGIMAIIQSFFVGLSTPVYQTREATFLLAILVAIALSYENKKAPNA